ncbi:MAG: DUF4062 domain-containing protein, partial [Clostridia bacterium]|nr:DUF4062 domain-containing protein [Clostridia bacterium]
MKLVFVSSTFKDMQFERDLLQTYAIPTLNNRLREYGEKAYFGDLRWGVNTTDLDSDEGSRKVLKVCLDQIDNCKPYMIVLIGERYGWIPAQELIDEACVLKGIEKIKDISVTELEIDYGALLNPEYEGRILFYFRRLDKSGMTEAELRDYCAESEIHFKKVEELKRRIEEIYPDHIRYYDAVWNAEEKRVTGLENFLSLVQSDLGDVLLRDLEEENRLPWQERSMQTSRRYFEEVNKSLAESSNSEVAYIGSAAEDGANFIYIAGEEGSGKSATVIEAYSKSDGERLAFSFGLDSFSRNQYDFEQVLLYKLEEILGYEHKAYSEYDGIVDILEYLSSLKEPIGIYVDNAGDEFLQFLSRLETEYRQSDTPVFLNATFYVAMQVDLPFYPFFDLSAKLVMTDLSEEDSALVLDGIVKSNHKEISDVVKKRILSKESSASAAYLKGMVKRLMILDSEDFAAIRAMGDGMDNINKYMISIVDSVSDDRYEILCELIEEAMDRINRAFVERLIGVFTHIPFGLNIDEIRDIFDAYGWEFNDLDFSLSTQMLEDVLSYNPYFRQYKIKNNAIEKSISRYSCEWNAIPATEYMLKSDELRPYAFRAAVLDAEPEYLISVLKRSGISDISKSICCLIERGLSERAISVLTAVASNEDFWEVSMLPSADLLLSDKHDLYYAFFKPFADGCVGNLTKAERSSLLLSTNIDARLIIAECALELSPEAAIEIILEAYKLSRSYAETAETDLINRLYFLLLKAVNKTKSVKLFERFFHGEEFLDQFDFDSAYDKTIFKMKVYTEFSEIAALLDEEL